MVRAERWKDDKAKREFEAVKQALDAQKTKYEIMQSAAVAQAAGAWERPKPNLLYLSELFCK